LIKLKGVALVQISTPIFVNMATSDFKAVLQAAEARLVDAGYKCELWAPAGGWSALDGCEASKDPFPQQYLAALQIFTIFFIVGEEPLTAWAHLAAEMQAGKTGVVQALYRLILTNLDKTHIPARNIFNVTGMSDNAWTKQIRDRLAEELYKGVSHGGGLSKIEARLKSLAAGDRLKNILIIVDESHLASSSQNRPCRHIYDIVAELCPTEQWATQNIRFLTISATDPAKAVTISGSSISAKLVVLETDANYQSVASLKASNRLRECGNLHIDPSAMEALKTLIAEKFPEPRYHIVRPRQRAYATVMERLREAFPDAHVMAWDSESKPEKPSSDGSTTIQMEDINELLETPPSQHTFILLKNMFYAAKTMEDAYVGVLYDRVGGKDDTNLQSLLGRACGYGKSQDTIIFTSSQTVTNYLDFWYAVIRQRPVPALTNIPVAKLDKKMANQRVYNEHALRVSHTHSAPIGGAAGITAPQRAPMGRYDAWTHRVEQFPTMAALNERWHTISSSTENLRTPQQKDGVYMCSIGKKSMKQTVQDMEDFLSKGFAGWGSGLTAAEKPGEFVHRVYAAYDNETVRFYLRWTQVPLATPSPLVGGGAV